MMTRVEHHPENGDAPWIVIQPIRTYGEVWFACRTQEEAETKSRDFNKVTFIPRESGDKPR
jgi:hypothetical protein